MTLSSSILSKKHNTSLTFPSQIPSTCFAFVLFDFFHLFTYLVTFLFVFIHLLDNILFLLVIYISYNYYCFYLLYFVFVFRLLFIYLFLYCHDRFVLPSIIRDMHHPSKHIHLFWVMNAGTHIKQNQKKKKLRSYICILVTIVSS